MIIITINIKALICIFLTSKELLLFLFNPDEILYNCPLLFDGKFRLLNLRLKQATRLYMNERKRERRREV